MFPRTRIGNLAKVFESGRSPLLNGLARLSVLYEDLRLELESALGSADMPKTGEQVLKYHYRSLYFLRRSLVTIQEGSLGNLWVTGGLRAGIE
jgi:hypothetical protein